MLADGTNGGLCCVCGISGNVRSAAGEELWEVCDASAYRGMTGFSINCEDPVVLIDSSGTDLETLGGITSKLTEA